MLTMVSKLGTPSPLGIHQLDVLTSYPVTSTVFSTNYQLPCTNHLVVPKQSAMDVQIPVPVSHRDTRTAHCDLSEVPRLDPSIDVVNSFFGRGAGGRFDHATSDVVWRHVMAGRPSCGSLDFPVLHSWLNYH